MKVFVNKNSYKMCGEKRKTESTEAFLAQKIRA